MTLVADVNVQAKFCDLGVIMGVSVSLMRVAVVQFISMAALVVDVYTKRLIHNELWHLGVNQSVRLCLCLDLFTRVGRVHIQAIEFVASFLLFVAASLSKLGERH